MIKVSKHCICLQLSLLNLAFFGRVGLVYKIIQNCLFWFAFNCNAHISNILRLLFNDLKFAFKIYDIHGFELSFSPEQITLVFIILFT